MAAHRHEDDNEYSEDRRARLLSIILRNLRTERESYHRIRDDIIEYLDTCYPKSRNPFRHGIVTENDYIKGAYSDALAASGARIIADGVRGSLAFGIATLTQESDVDAAVLVEDEDPVRIEDSIASTLNQRGIQSNVVIVNPSQLSAPDDTRRSLKACMYLAVGFDFIGEPDTNFALATQYLQHLNPLRVIAYLRLAGAPAEISDKYSKRLKQYQFRFMNNNTVFQQRPDLFQ